MKTVNIFLLVLSLIISVIASCTKSKNIADSTKPIDSIKVKENVVSIYEFIGLDSSDYHYYAGSPNGGIDRSKDSVMSSVFSLKLVMEYLDDSLRLDSSTITNYEKGVQGHTFSYYLKNDTLFTIYRADTPEGFAEGTFNKKDSILSICRDAYFVYDKDRQLTLGRLFAHDGTGFMMGTKDEIFGRIKEAGASFASEKDMKNPQDRVVWANLKFNYKIKKR